MQNKLRLLRWVAILCTLAISTMVQADTYVRGYVRSNGTYVQPHMRSSPDGNPYNNFSFPGNVDPYTGKVAPGNPDTYLKNYYGRMPSTTTIPALNFGNSSPTAAAGEFGASGSRRPPSLQREIRSGLSSPNGPSLKSAQLALALHGFDVGPIDGRSGPGTARALRRFQQRHRLPVTGTLDAGTAVALMDSLSTFSSPTLGGGSDTSSFQVTRSPTGTVTTPGSAVVIPEHAQLNYLGAGWECVRGYQQIGPACKRVEVPQNARLDYLGHSWECERGFQQAGSACIPVQLPTHASLDYLGHSWTCERGYQHAGASCAPVTVPPNGTLDYTGHSWTCQRGYAQAGSSCVPVGIPDNAQLDYTGHSWICLSGFTQSGASCVPVVVPARAQLDYTGHGWTCARGYQQAGADCIRVMIPEHARLDYTGHSWACERGFVSTGSSCQMP